MKQEELNKVKKDDVELKEDWSNLLRATRERARQVAKIAHRLSKPKGLLKERKKCPECGKRLWFCCDGVFFYYVCKECQYEWAYQANQEPINMSELMNQAEGKRLPYEGITLEDLIKKYNMFGSKYGKLSDIKKFVI